MKFHYRGFDVSGQPTAGSIDSVAAAEASETLRRQGTFVTEISEAAGSSNSFGSGHRAPRAGVRLKNLAMFTRQLQVLVSTGTPLAQSLGALERQSTSPSWRAVVSDLRSRVESGSSLSGAMAEHPGHFDSISRSLIAAGESAGNLPVMLDQLASLSRKQLQVRRSIVGAAVYPALLVVVAMTVLIVLLTFVLPRFAELFKSLDTPLPPTTRALMAISAALRAYWWVFSIVILGVGAGAWAWLRSAAGKRATDSVLLVVPQLGGIIKSFATARISRLLGILIQGRVPMLEALELTRGACTNWHYAALIEGAVQSVTRGESLALALSDPRLVPPSVHEAISSGERSGQLAPLLTTLADFMDETNDVTVRSLASILEPMILVVLGLLVGFVAVSLFTPLFDLTAATGGGQ